MSTTTPSWIKPTRHFCAICNISIYNNQASIRLHEQGTQHQENLRKRNVNAAKQRQKTREDEEEKKKLMRVVFPELEDKKTTATATAQPFYAPVTPQVGSHQNNNNATIIPSNNKTRDEKNKKQEDEMSMKIDTEVSVPIPIKIKPIDETTGLGMWEPVSPSSSLSAPPIRTNIRRRGELTWVEKARFYNAKLERSLQKIEAKPTTTSTLQISWPSMKEEEDSLVVTEKKLNSTSSMLETTSGSTGVSSRKRKARPASTSALSFS